MKKVYNITSRPGFPSTRLIFSRTRVNVTITHCFIVTTGHLDMVKFLLEAGADQEHKTDEMHTALMEASMDGHVEVAKLLLDSGAQVHRSR